MKSIKWRGATPLYRAGVTVATVAGLIAVTGAPMKWCSFVSIGW